MKYPISPKTFIPLGTKLNLGSRDRFLEGYQNMDCDPHEGVDFVGNVGDLSLFGSESIEAIRASHVLEHFPHVRTISVLKEWLRVLVPGGILEVAVPDFKRAVDLCREGLNPWVENFLMGDQEYKTAFHYALFDEAKLRRCLIGAGFSEASRVVEFQTSDPKECSNKISTFDLKPVSLNMVAIR